MSRFSKKVLTVFLVQSLVVGEYTYSQTVCTTGDVVFTTGASINNGVNTYANCFSNPNIDKQVTFANGTDQNNATFELLKEGVVISSGGNVNSITIPSDELAVAEFCLRIYNNGATCYAESCFDITSTQSFTFDIRKSNDLGCGDNTAIIDASYIGNNPGGVNTCSGTTNGWDTQGGNITSTDNFTIGSTRFFEANVDAIGIYTLCILVENCPHEREIDIVIDNETDITILGGTDRCPGGQISIEALPSASIPFTYNWTTSDGNIVNQNQAELEADLGGTYTVSVENTTLNCTGSIEVAVNDILLDPILTAVDSTICLGEQVSLNVTDGDNWEWGSDPTNPLVSANDMNSLTDSPTANTTYTVTVSERSTAGNRIEVVTNGDFESGNSGFDPGIFMFVNTQSSFSQYGIVTNANTWGPGFASNCSDASGAGNMMVVDGSEDVGDAFWCQTVTIDPNRDYTFEFSATSVNPNTPALIQATVGGVSVGDLQLTGATCDWSQRFVSTPYDSGTNTSVEICLLDMIASGGGNDFAVDNISFFTTEGCQEVRELDITIIPQDTTRLTQDTIICAGGTAQLVFNGSPNITIDYTDGTNDFQTTLDAMGSSVVSVMPAVETEYKQIGSSLSCDGGRDSVVVSIQMLPVLETVMNIDYCSKDTILINTIEYQEANLSSIIVEFFDQAFQPLANEYVATQNDTIIAIADLNGCEDTAKIAVDFNELPTIDMVGSSAICGPGDLDVLFTNGPSVGRVTFHDGVTDFIVDLDVAGAATHTYSIPASGAINIFLTEIEDTITGCLAKGNCP